MEDKIKVGKGNESVWLYIKQQFYKVKLITINFNDYPIWCVAQLFNYLINNFSLSR